MLAGVDGSPCRKQAEKKRARGKLDVIEDAVFSSSMLISYYLLLNNMFFYRQEAHHVQIFEINILK